MPTDWNEATLGIYRGSPESGSNGPSSSTASMGYLVSLVNSAVEQGVQIYFENNGNYLVWFRTRSKGNESWKAWRSISTTA